MLFLSETFIGTPVMSLQTGSELGVTKQAVIDPRNLTIVAFYLDGPNLDRTPSLLLCSDIREVGDLGLIINSNEELVVPDDVFSMRTVLELNFNPIELPVVDDKGTKLGKVSNYTVDATSFVIQQLSVRRPLLQNLTTTELLIHRKQIIGVTSTQITVRSTTAKQPVAERTKLFANPFKNAPKPES